MTMENERVVYNPLAIGSGANADGGFGGGIGSLLLLALLGRGRGGVFGGGECCDNPADGIAAKVVQLQNTGDIKEEIKDTESKLRETILAQTIGMNQEFRTVDSKIDKANLHAVKAGLEAKIATLEATNSIKDRVCEVEHKIEHVECSLKEKINASTQSILDRLVADKLDEKNDEIADLRARNRQHQQNEAFVSQFANVNALLSTLVNQNQHLTNKIVQFGAGNTAIPVASNTNVG